MASHGSIKLTTRTEISTPMSVLQTLLKPFRPLMAVPLHTPPRGSPKLDVPSSVSKACNVKEYQVDDIWIYELVNKTIPQESKVTHRHYYYCGGGWALYPQSQHWALLSALCNDLPDIRFHLVSIPLSPTNTADYTMPVLERLTSSVVMTAIANNETLSFGGDSSGGYLAILLSSFASISESGPIPITNIFLMSPVVDYRETQDIDEEVSKSDPILTVSYSQKTGRKWAGSIDRNDPKWSPLIGDLSPLLKRHIKIHGVYGTHDISSTSNKHFHERLDELGFEGEWLRWEGQIHNFPLLFEYHITEGKEGKAWIVDVLKRNCSSQSSSVEKVEGVAAVPGSDPDKR